MAQLVLSQFWWTIWYSQGWILPCGRIPPYSQRSTPPLSGNLPTRCAFKGQVHVFVDVGHEVMKVSLARQSQLVSGQKVWIVTIWIIWSIKAFADWGDLSLYLERARDSAVGRERGGKPTYLLNHLPQMKLR